MNLGHRFGNKKGQSLAELATFGVVLISVFGLLVSYAMNANYQQRANMLAFRQAYARAKQYDPLDGVLHLMDLQSGRYRWQALKQSIPAYLSVPPWSYNVVTETDWNIPSLPPPASNNNKYVSYTIIEDKPIPQVSGVLSLGKRTPIVASAEAVWSIDLYSGSQINLLQPDFTQLFSAIDPRNLPRADFEINGERYSYVTNYLASIPDFSDVVMQVIPIALPGGNIIQQLLMPEIGVIVDRFIPSMLTRTNDDEVDGPQDYTSNEVYTAGGHTPEGLPYALLRQEETNQGSKPGITTTENVQASEVIERNFSFRRGKDHYVRSTLEREKEESWYTPNE